MVEIKSMGSVVRSDTPFFLTLFKTSCLVVTLKNINFAVGNPQVVVSGD